MKKIILSLLAVATIVSCNKVGNNEFEIEGNASGFKDGRNVYLQMQVLQTWEQEQVYLKVL